MTGGASTPPVEREARMTRKAEAQVIESTAGEVAAELQRRGISADERVTLTIEPELFPGRRASRKLVITAGLTDEDIDRLIEKAREEVAPGLE
jgi:hypothetical protein